MAPKQKNFHFPVPNKVTKIRIMIQVSNGTWEFDSLPAFRFLELNVLVHATADGQVHSIFGSCVSA